MNETTRRPAMTVTVLGFDYSKLKPGVATKARNAAIRIKRTLAGASIDAGRDLLIAKEALDHGQFGAWIRVELHMSARTAERLIGAAGVVAKYPIAKDLKPTLLYALAAPSTPAAVQEYVIQQLAAGGDPTLAAVRKLIAETKAPKPQTSGHERATPVVKITPLRPFHVSPDVRRKLVRRLSPADQPVFWGRIRIRQGRYYIDKLTNGLMLSI